MQTGYKRWEPCTDAEKQPVKHVMACYASDLHESRKWPTLNVKQWRSEVGLASFQELFMEGYSYSSPVPKSRAQTSSSGDRDAIDSLTHLLRLAYSVWGVEARFTQHLINLHHLLKSQDIMLINSFGFFLYLSIFVFQLRAFAPIILMWL